MAQLRPVFQNIANAIREKNGLADTYTPEQMPGAIKAIESGGAKNEQLDVVSNGTYTAPEGVGYNPVVVNVPQDGAPTAEELTITGNCGYRFSNDGWNWIINKYGNQITTKDISNCENMFLNCQVENIPFEINCKIGTEISCQQLFQGCKKLKNIPKFNNCKLAPKVDKLFFECEMVAEFPKDFEKGFDFTEYDKELAYFYSDSSSLLYGCVSLRHLPIGFLKHGNPKANYIRSIYSSGFSSCHCLDEIIDLPNPHYNTEFTENTFIYTFDYCFHLKDLTFAPTMTNGESNNPQWSNQIIDLTKYVGYGGHLKNYFPAEKEIKDDATYQQLKNDPDAWTALQEYSRYNHDSAVRTINSLPDTSAFIASNGGTNTIKFAGANGSKTDGGAINTLTPEEIAVATAKGWTVSLE